MQTQSLRLDLKNEPLKVPRFSPGKALLTPTHAKTSIKKKKKVVMENTYSYPFRTLPF